MSDLSKEEAEKLRNNMLSRLREVESKLKAVQEKLSEKDIPDMKEEDFLNFKDILFEGLGMNSNSNKTDSNKPK